VAHGKVTLVADGKPTLMPRGFPGMLKAAQWSLQGLWHCFRLESSFRLEVYLLPLVAALGFWLGQTAVEKAILVGVLLPVLVAELLNSVAELLVDRLWPGPDRFAGIAKDMGSAAVFLALANVVVVWLLVLWPRMFP
jgi:diacylglycerol kinase (ATP)